MKLKKLLSERWISVYILIAAAILYFIYSLGFMTNFYRLFYDGSRAMLEVYKELQLLNKFLFGNALLTLILAISALALELHIKKCSILNAIYLIGFIAYEISCLSTVMGSIPYYINKYSKLDFSSLEGFNSSTFMLTLSYVFIIGILIILIIISISFIIFILKQMRESRGVKSYE